MGRFGDRRGARKGPRWNNGLTRKLPRTARITKYQSTEDTPNRPSPQTTPLILDGVTSTALEKRFENLELRSLHDEQMGFSKYESGASRMGWMVNMQSTLVKDSEWKGGRSAVDFYFLEEDGQYFKATIKYSPYFYVKCKVGTETKVEDYLRRQAGNTIESIQRVSREDLDMPNHVSGLKRIYLKLSFRNTDDLQSIKKALQPLATKNGQFNDDFMASLQEIMDDHNEILHGIETRSTTIVNRENKLSGEACIVDLREHDIPYHLRVCIDLKLRAGLWYTVQTGAGDTTITRILGKDVRPDPVVLAFDIETTKLPLKFPDSDFDQIMMISYMIDGQGYLIINRSIVSQDIDNFEYTPKSEYPGQFTTFNEVDERATLNRFFSHILLVRPVIFVTYNGDSFDWPFVDARCNANGISMRDVIGFWKNSQDEYEAPYAIHMDCYKWVKRDSYLPAGSQGLKSVTTIKLGYDPLELDPEEMTPLASRDPQTLASYSVSDAVATYYLYMKYVHPFIFSLCTIIPLTPDEVLRKGSGTLCETLLMAEAWAANVIMPNRHAEMEETFHNGHLLYSETYIGGHVESLESGIFRSDFDYKFKLKPEGFDQLINDLDRALTFCLKCEGVDEVSTVTNYEKIKNDILNRLESLRQTPMRTDKPLIYHLDVAAMYPNIILTNRLQPSAMVDESMCAVCDHNRPGKQCQRIMNWSWRGEFYTAKMSEYKQVRAQLDTEKFTTEGEVKGMRTKAFHELGKTAQNALIQKRLTKYSQKVYNRVRATEVVKKQSIVCQKENAFYIDTVRNFRDRRYEYKDKLKQSKKLLEDAIATKNAARMEEGNKLTILYDSLQLAHKCILNSFYGYVMRKGARWYSMEMGGIVCETGAEIIKLARELVEQVGRPLELDTDGIWCMLPKPFPQNYTFEVKKLDGNIRKIFFAYPCVMLNHLVHDKFTNHQYHTLMDPVKLDYRISAENSIFFEIDGPYKAMILPSSTEEGKLLKKRYAVFAEDGKLAELKGFEVKRRGELKVVKVFQTQLFRTFLDGDSLQGCYAEVAKVANYWLDIIYSRGASMSDTELFELISENRSMSKALEEYGEQKSTSISTAKRLAEFLGEEMIKDKGLACRFVISAKPIGDPVTTRAIPVAIFSADAKTKRKYLRKWLKDNSLDEHVDPRTVMDWPYYLERLESIIQKLIVIPAAMQGVSNPVPRVNPPSWLQKRVSELKGEFKQTKLSFTKKSNDLDEEIQASDEEESREEEKENKNTNTTELPDMESSYTLKLFGFKRKPGKSTKRIITNQSVTIHDDYSIWIQQQRPKWRALRMQLSKSTKEQPDTFVTDKGKRRALSSESALKLPWQIIHHEQRSPGHYNVWTIIGGQLRKLALIVPRRLYVHAFKDIIKDDEVLLSILTPIDTWRLPVPYSVRGEPASNKVHYLYELKSSETAFTEHFHTLSAAFSHPHIEQVYEMDVPLEFTLGYHLGCITSVDQKRLSEIATRQRFEFELDDLSGFKSIAYQPYLEDSDQRIAFLFIGHVQLDNKHVIALSLSSQRECFPLKFIVVDPTGKTGTTLPNVKKVLTDLEIDSKSRSGFFGNCFGMIETSIITENIKDLKDLIIEYLQKCSRKTQHKHVTMAFLHSNGELKLDLPMPIMSTSPSLFIPSGLDWIRNCMRSIITNAACLSDLVLSMISFSRYSHLPLGSLINHLDLDDKSHGALLTYISDTFMARSLRSKGYLLPHKCKDTEIAHESPLITLSELPYERTGAFTTVCIELSMSGLAINAMLEYKALQSPESVSPNTIEDALKQASHDDVDAVFETCRTLVRNWARDFSSEGQVKMEAQRMLSHFYRWIRTTTTHSGRFFHASTCYELLNAAIIRCRSLLIETVQKLGSLVLYCDFHRLVIRTSKDDYWAAMAYWRYLSRQLGNTLELQYIDFTPITTWRCLIWLDSANFAGARIEMVDESNEINEKLVMRWAISDYLPPMLQIPFKNILAQYISNFHNQINIKKIDQDTNSLPMTFIPNTDMLSDEPHEIPEHRAFLPFSFSQKFLTLIKDVQRAWTHPPPLDKTERSKWDQQRIFPVLPGSHLSNMSSGPLEFVKFSTAIFSIYQPSRRYVYSLLKQSFALLNQSEFSDAAQFKHPCRSIRLTDIVCLGCLTVRDLDFGRDADLQPIQNSTTPMSMYCQQCSTPLDMTTIEEELIIKVNSLITDYQSYDLACNQCKYVPATIMKHRCARCTGNYTTQLKADDRLNNVQAFLRIAKTFGMYALMEVCEFVLSK